MLRSLFSQERPPSGFAADLYRFFAAVPGNLFFSPYSIAAALAMLHAGAAGRTREEIAAVLHREERRGILDLPGLALPPDSPSILRTANGLWGQAGYPFRESFLETIEQDFGARAGAADFTANPEAICAEINGWVEEKTAGRIRNLLSPDMLDPLTRLVLVNAIYFKSRWADEFDPAATLELPFHLAGGSTVQAAMMRQTGRKRYRSVDGLQVLELPYRGGELSMILVLPAPGGLPDLERAVSGDHLARWTEHLVDAEVQLLLPRFTLTFSTRLEAALTAMGIQAAFDPNAADFSGIDGGAGGLHVSAAVHKAFVEVNEEGTEAAAATGIAMHLRSMGPPPVRFYADRPFLFLIRDNGSGEILFIGRLADPTLKG